MATRNPNRARVNIYDDCSVDCESVNVSITEQDQIEWYSTGRAAFTVDFGQFSPFNGTTFNVPANGSISSGPASGNALEVTYHYTIARAVAGGSQVAADPDVNVKR